MNIKYLIYFLIVLFSESCNFNNNNSNSVNHDVIVTGAKINDSMNIDIGDCFVIENDSLNNFGLILSEINPPPNYNIDYSFIPIQLNINKKDLDKFRFGKIKIISVPSGFSGDFIKGYHAIHVSKRDFINIFKELKKLGNLKIKEEYNNINGGGLIGSISEIKSFFYYLDIPNNESIHPKSAFLPVSSVFYMNE